jgi:hypothetical protein
MRAKILANVVMVVLLFGTFSTARARKAYTENVKSTAAASAAIWRQPQNIAARNLFYGAGGESGLPSGRLRFIEEDKGGTSPKFVVEDAAGARWKIKLGNETQSETAATRLLWAVGYFTDVNYYAPKLKIIDLPRLSRGQEFVSAGGTVHGARLEREYKGMKKIGTWSWYDNPFLHTKEFNGLRVMMALINNWDLKESNNGIYQVPGGELRYLVTDLGATFGKTGGDWTRSKNDLEDYLASDFIDEVEPTRVDLNINSRPPALYAVAYPYYSKRTRMEKVGNDIPRAHARWIGRMLAQLSASQISDAFRGSGYKPYEVSAYSRKVQERIRQLNRL